MIDCNNLSFLFEKGGTQIERQYKIYVHVNKMNGKLYIGQTCQIKESNRYGVEGIGYKKCPIFWNAIQKYGWNNFEHIILFDHLTKEVADIIEIELINKYKTTNQNYGYNLSKGGHNSFDFRRKKIYQHNKNGNLINVWNCADDIAYEFGYLSSCISSNCRREIKSAYGFVWSYRKLKSNEVKEILYSGNSAVKQYDKFGDFINDFASIREASNETNISYGSIQTSCQNKGVFLVDNKYRFIYYKESLNESKIKNKKNIDQFDLYGNFIKTWEDTNEIKSILGINTKYVTRCCNEQVRTYKDSIWRYSTPLHELYIEDIESYVSKSLSSKPKRIKRCTLDGKLIDVWESSGEAARQLFNNVERAKTIRRCCNGKIKYCYGYKWCYYD